MGNSMGDAMREQSNNDRKSLGGDMGGKSARFPYRSGNQNGWKSFIGINYPPYLPSYTRFYFLNKICHLL